MTINVQIVDARLVATEMAAYFAAQSNPAAVVFTLKREISKQNNQGTPRGSRVVIALGDDNGKAGKFSAPKLSFPRQIATWNQLFELRVWGFDPSSPNDEGVQYQAAYNLLAAALNSLRHTAKGHYQLSDPEWTIVPVERVLGMEVIVQVTLEVPILNDEVTNIDQPTPPAQEPTYTADMSFASGDVQACPHN